MNSTRPSFRYSSCRRLKFSIFSSLARSFRLWSPQNDIQDKPTMIHPYKLLSKLIFHVYLLRVTGVSLNLTHGDVQKLFQNILWPSMRFDDR